MYCCIFINHQALQQIIPQICLSRLSDMVLIDRRKAFDTLDHKILLDRVKCIGFSDQTLKWFHYYLINRGFFVSLNNQVGTINCGVPHWSILGHLFSPYINYIPQALSDSHTYLYVYDTSIFSEHKDVAEIENVLHKEFVNACEWVVDNKPPPIHFGEYKTICILFSRKKLCGA